MRVKMYGTRGSIPVCDPDYYEFGGNTTCVQITLKDTGHIGILDAGTGIRKLGREFIGSGPEQLKELIIGFTHFHWDHIHGLPFFGPAFNPEQNITLIALGRDRNIENLRDIFTTQMQKDYFPVRMEQMGAKFKFLYPDDLNYTTGRGTKLTAIAHSHPGGAYTYRSQRSGKKFVFSTDIEHGEKIDEDFISFCKNADLLIHDAQYTSEELKKRKGWGHSSFEQAIQVAEMAEVKYLVMTHHDPDHDDEFLKKIEKECQDRFKDCELAREGVEYDL